MLKEVNETIIQCKDDELCNEKSVHTTDKRCFYDEIRCCGGFDGKFI